MAMAMWVLLVVLLLLHIGGEYGAEGHAAMTFPKPRNSVDGSVAPWSQWAYPCDATHQGDDCKITFCEDGKDCQGSCPISAHSGVPSALNGSNGQSCYWFSNGCTIGCEACDGTQNHVGHGSQQFLYKGMSQKELLEKNLTISDPFTSRFLTLDPKHKNFTIAPNCENPTTNATICDPRLRTCNTQAECGGPDDFYYYSPWRAPGSAPVLDPCGIAGGRLEGQPIGPAGAQFENSSVAKRGDRGSQLKPLGSAPAAVWTSGSFAEVGWTVMANHGGGYQYRMAPANEPLTEALFQQMPLAYEGASYLRWDGNIDAQLEFSPAKLGWETNQGTIPAGSMWRKNPIPSGLWQREGATFSPLCEESEECIKVYSSGNVFSNKQGVCKCSGFSNGGPLLPNLEIVDTVKVPTLPPGRYVLQWRWDCEESDQVWSSCSDIEVVAP